MDLRQPQVFHWLPLFPASTQQWLSTEHCWVSSALHHSTQFHSNAHFWLISVYANVSTQRFHTFNSTESTLQWPHTSTALASIESRPMQHTAGKWAPELQWFPRISEYWTVTPSPLRSASYGYCLKVIVLAGGRSTHPYFSSQECGNIFKGKQSRRSAITNSSQRKAEKKATDGWNPSWILTTLSLLQRQDLLLFCNSYTSQTPSYF